MSYEELLRNIPELSGKEIKFALMSMDLKEFESEVRRTPFIRIAAIARRVLPILIEKERYSPVLQMIKEKYGEQADQLIIKYHAELKELRQREGPKSYSLVLKMIHAGIKEDQLLGYFYSEMSPIKICKI